MRSWPFSSYDRAFVQHAADALRHAARDLALDDGRVDQRAAVLHHEVAVDRDPSGRAGRPRPSSSASPATSRPRGWRSRSSPRCRGRCRPGGARWRDRRRWRCLRGAGARRARRVRRRCRRRASMSAAVGFEQVGGEPGRPALGCGRRRRSRHRWPAWRRGCRRCPTRLNGVTWVSPATMRTRSSGTPSSSAASCASVVWWPWPWGDWLVKTVSEPSGSRRAVARCRAPGAAPAPSARV